MRRGGGLGENLDLSFFFFGMCNAMRANRRSEQREPHNCDKKCDEGKTTYLLDGKPRVNQKGRKRRGMPTKRNKMRKIVRYRKTKNAVPEPEQHRNGGRRGSRRKQAAT